MSLRTHNPADNHEIGVCAVIGNEVRMYGPMPKNSNVRPYRGKRVFSNKGQALDFADEYEAGERGQRVKRTANSLTLRRSSAQPRTDNLK